MRANSGGVWPLRRVERTEDCTTRYNRPGEGSRIHYLSCGHTVVTKQSGGYPRRKRCDECPEERHHHYRRKPRATSSPEGA